jgi:hypothetical protein
MASTFPGAIDSFIDPLSGSALNSPSHSSQHADLNSAVNKIENYMGLVKVLPTSIASVGGTGATLSSTGTVNIGTSNTSVSILGCFSSLYSNYLISFNGISVASAAISLNCFLLSGSTPTSSGWYGSEYFITVNTTTQSGQITANNAGAVFCSAGTSTSGLASTMQIQSPFLTQQTRMQYNVCASDYYRYGLALHTAATSYNGIQFTPTSGSITGGSITVYGHRI